jgi:hypothetical protein
MVAAAWRVLSETAVIGVELHFSDMVAEGLTELAALLLQSVRPLAKKCGTGP